MCIYQTNQTMQYKSFIIPVFLFLALGSQAQRDSYVPEIARNYDYTYYETIKSVRLYPADSEVDYPVIGLNSGIQLVLEFDDLEAFAKNFYYKIIHCNADWTISEDIAPMDYVDGFAENRFYHWEGSVATRNPYIHYELRFPNDDIKLTKSGNYLLKVYLDADEEDLVITRRFMVVDTKLKVVPQLRRSATPPYSTTHQEIFFNIQHSSLPVGNPNKEIRVVILQNGRWDNAIFNPAPTFYQYEEITYDIQGKLAFAGGKEFRPLDLRSYRYRTNQVQNLQQLPNGFIVDLFADVPRKYSAYLFTNDLNGKFIIQTFDWNDNHTRGEYGNINFTLKTPKQNGDVYVVGGFSQFLPYEENKMKYDEENNVYTATLFLKNGFYDYQYVLVPPNDGKTTPAPDFVELEGSTFEAENDYLFLVYYRPFGARYEQLVAVQKMNSRPK